ncbi:MAG: metallophosphoesterase family protein [Anaerolineales bacterium]|nr:metallophosphoesterase family protein [Anaerolineales bacterium]
MRALVLSDIHANAAALDSVLEQAGPVDSVWCLGDVVGYGPDPNRVISRLQGLSNLVCLQGNHDAAAIGELGLEGFNLEARTSIEWLRDELSQESYEFLRQLQPRAEISGVTLAHASPRQPVLEYLLDVYSAGENFDHFDGPFCFVGHTHIPVLFQQREYTVSLHMPKVNTTITLDPRCIANPGSVGQPRDRDPRAAFAIYDDQQHTWDYQRVEYDIDAVQKRMRSAGLPERHITRLASGW